MTFLELQNAVVLKDFEAKADIATEIKQWINDAYLRIARYDLSAFLKIATITTVSGINNYLISSNIIDYRKMNSVVCANYGDVEWQSKQRADMILYDSDASEQVSGRPQVMWKRGNYLYVYPVPDAAYTLNCEYYHIPDRMVSDDDGHVIPETYEEFLVDYAKKIYDGREKDYDGVTLARQDLRNDIIAWLTLDQEDSGDSSGKILLPKEYENRFRTKKDRRRTKQRINI